MTTSHADTLASLSHATQAEHAARLLASGLTPRLRPAHDPEYAVLVQRYRTDATFRTVVDAVARGLGLLVLDAADHGVVLGADDDSPFALRVADYRPSTSLEERVCHGLIQLAIAAWCYPTAAELEDPDAVIKRVSSNQIVTYLVRLAEELKAQADEDPDFATPELEEAWRAVLSRARTRGTVDGRRAPKALSGMVAYALETLERAGLLKKASDDDGGTWRTLGRYRVQVRELAAHESFTRILDAGRAARNLAEAEQDRRA